MNAGVALLVILGLVASLQYWRGRRLNLTLIRELSRQMEEALQPVNKNYTWIGGYVGVVAEYDLKHEVYEKVKGTISLLPHHSLLYFPLSLLLGRKDRVYILIYPKRNLKGKAHIARGKIKGISQASFKDTVRVKGVVLQRCYNSKEEAEFMTKIISRLKDPSSLEHLAANVEENAYYARLRIGRGDISELLRCFIATVN
ncbi:hypothetical protein [Acetomicrobium sp. UBA5826]|uniref:hypothetical protein n=1 Tax=Acetomicrobium sp. UBA5826 TaxID=1946039 RepID=UPI00257BA9C4|nr:hypothetical protein [Acetomicrobium sp. UBA5826]